jgi:hypothetical protein
MPSLLVTYDPARPERDYSDFLKHIERYSNARLSESSYAIITDKTPQAVCGELRRFVKKNGSLFVITLKQPYDGCGPSLTNDWLRKTLTDE